MLLSALESSRSYDQRQKDASSRREDEFNKLIDELKKTVEVAKSTHLEDEKVIGELKNEVDLKGNRIRTLEAQVKDACDKLRDANSQMSRASISVEKSKKEVVDAVARAERAEAQISELKVQAENAAKEASERITELEGRLFNTYDQGMFHMARCHVIGSGNDINDANVEMIADWMVKDQFCDDLRRAHPWMPFSELDVIEYNDARERDGLEPWSPPETRERNLRAVYETKLDQLEQAAREARVNVVTEVEADGGSKTVDGEEVAKPTEGQDADLYS